MKSITKSAQLALFVVSSIVLLQTEALAGGAANWTNNNALVVTVQTGMTITIEGAGPSGKNGSSASMGFLLLFLGIPLLFRRRSKK